MITVAYMYKTIKKIIPSPMPQTPILRKRPAMSQMMRKNIKYGSIHQHFTEQKKTKRKTAIWHLIRNKVNMKQHHPQGNELKERKRES